MLESLFFKGFVMDEIQYKKWVGALFDKSAAAYGTHGTSYFNYFASQLVAQIELLPGASVLDIATGRGALLREIAKKVGSQGNAIGIDLSSEMVAKTSHDFKHHPHVSIKQMDAEQLLFANSSFDHVFCGFGLFFMPDVKKVLSETKRVLKKKGVFALSTWRQRGYAGSMLRDYAIALGADPKVTIHDFSNLDFLKQTLEENGFKILKMVDDNYDQVHPDVTAWWDSLWSHGTRGILEQLSREKQQILQSQLKEKLDPSLKSDGLHEIYQAHYTLVQSI